TASSRNRPSPAHQCRPKRRRRQRRGATAHRNRVSQRFSRLGAVREKASANEPTASPSRLVNPPRLAIVGPPFANWSGNPEHEPFVDGVTESLTTDLSRIRGSFIITRHTAFAHKRNRPRTRRPPCARGEHFEERRTDGHQRATRRRRDRRACLGR